MALAVYDSGWRLYQKYISVEYSVNWSVFFFASLWGFIAVIALVLAKYTMGKFDKGVVYILSLPFIFRFCLNLCSINQSWEFYRMLNDNWGIDLVQWLAVSITLFIWQKNIH